MKKSLNYARIYVPKELKWYLEEERVNNKCRNMQEYFEKIIAEKRMRSNEKKKSIFPRL